MKKKGNLWLQSALWVTTDITVSTLLPLVAQGIDIRIETLLPRLQFYNRLLRLLFCAKLTCERIELFLTLLQIDIGMYSLRNSLSLFLMLIEILSKQAYSGEHVCIKQSILR